MFHKVYQPGALRTIESFSQYLEYLHHTFPVVLPGEPLVAPVSVSLIFDDAYVDFYACVFPLLKKWKIKALLAVPTQYIPDSVDLPLSERLAKSYRAGWDTPGKEVNNAFCSWAELQEMVDSGHVVVASHTQSHRPVSALRSLPDQLSEILDSKIILEKRLGRTIEHFVYPYGNYTRSIHQFVSKHYRYAHRIGNALNTGKSILSNSLLYRVDAESLFRNNIAIEARQMRAWWWRSLWNRMRFK